MALYNIYGKPIIPGERKERHWKIFDKIKKSTRHQEIIKHLESEILKRITNLSKDEEVIDSSIIGKDIIGNMRKESLDIYNELYHDLQGGVFGMMLFDILSRDTKSKYGDWNYLDKSIDKFDDSKGSQYFRKK
ncbi:MAG: hypothetical protein LWX07_03840 [Bacteroidetes bacterium]|nr:hypothetical protein [Bacteroidota bacterium]